MTSPPSDLRSAEGITSEKDSSIASLSITSKKRCRDTLAEDGTTSANHTDQPSESLDLQISDQSYDPCTTREICLSDNRSTHGHDDLDHSRIDLNLRPKQRKFVRQWFDAFVKSESKVILSNEAMNALATLTQAPPQLIIDYIKNTYTNPTEVGAGTSIRPLDTDPSRQRTLSCSQESYTLTTANKHLLPATLALVTKYIMACRRPRPGIDGRRTVNTGPFHCTIGCGYRTKRSFDWRRHEETHEPQELWLCTLCSPTNTHEDTQTDGGKNRITFRKEPFLVSRKDKFLKHAKESHKEWEPEKVLGLSKVEYKPSVDLHCPKCGTGSKTWDERCKHVLGHFEDEAEQTSKRQRFMYEVTGQDKTSVEGSIASNSVSCDDSDNEDTKEDRNHLANTD
ncbi:hypothetical protein BKA66DRAFT_405447 [Pyrenochaeta sp. MPI-SDFR-AT-0127]|nr:hypothetical protein BKA66DRAFT_405447 [Pyrenochaeta sp. MPI-SDFR-AT-0127]